MRAHRVRDQLEALALDLRWAWSHSTDDLWERLDPVLWGTTRNPWLVLQATSDRDLASFVADRDNAQALERCVRRHAAALATPAWFSQIASRDALSLVAYFSMEFGLSEALPIYAGGLGVLGGDHLKAASDLGVPLVAVGLLYSEGYFRQLVDASGEQHELAPPNDPGQLPIRRALDRDGAEIRIPIELPGRTVFARAWVAQTGRTWLYLLDCNDPTNGAADRGITAELYGGSEETRLQQQLVLGVGGYRLLTALGLRPEVVHLNEGHAAFAGVERARAFMTAEGGTFAQALRATRIGTIFTTHTAVEAAFDRFPPSLARRYLHRYAETIGIEPEELLALGRREQRDDEPFTTAYLALRCSGRVNAVSRVHGEVARALFQPFFPRCPAPEVPIGYVTNGVHAPSWDSREADRVWSVACGAERWRWDMSGVSEGIAGVSDAELWQLRTANRRQLVRVIRETLLARLGEADAPPERLAEVRRTFAPDVLTIGFARRMTGYKRPGLLLRDPERLARIIADPARPVQLVIAGKAHPQDEEGKAAVRAWARFAEREDVRERVAFVQDYDLLLAEQLVQGCDLWVNTPRARWEACGTSGMKVLVNGGLNLSVLDGWWAEAYADDVGWAIGDGRWEPGDAADARDAEQLYRLLEGEVRARFYDRAEDGIPRRWVATMRASMTRLTTRFSANRMVREYVADHYLPAAAAFRERTAAHGAAARRIERELAALGQGWSGLAFGPVAAREDGGRRIVDVPLATGALDPALIAVEAYADAVDGAARERHVLHRTAQTSDGMLHYEGALPAGRSIDDYTIRVVPAVPGLAAPLESALIRWQR